LKVDAGAISHTSKQRDRDSACTIFENTSENVFENDCKFSKNDKRLANNNDNENQTEFEKKMNSSSESRKSVKDSHRSGVSCRTRLKTNAEVEVEVENEVEPDVACLMGGKVKSKSGSVWPHESSPTPTQTSSMNCNGPSIDGSRIDGPWERPSRLSTGHNAKTDSEVRDEAERRRIKKTEATWRSREAQLAEDLLLDSDADKFGPLTETEMAAARESVKFDPLHPVRPSLRVEPIGVFVPDSYNFKRFKQAAMVHDYMIKLVDNPKQVGKDSWKRYKKYQAASTFREIIELSVTSSDPKVRKWQRSTALKDIAHDSSRGFILFPQHENKSPSHFVNALTVARMNSTVCIESLYSNEELEEAREKKVRRVLKKIEKREQKLKSGEGYGVALLTFQEQSLSLWEHDEVLARLDACYHYESMLGAVAVARMLAEADDIPEPTQYRQATSPTHPEREQWLASMGRERSTLLQSRGTWILVKRKSIGSHKPVKCKYVYKKKRNKDSTIQFKSRLVGCGYSQIRGIDFSSDEVYAGVCSYSSMRF